MLQEKAMLVSLSIQNWEGKKFDKKVTKEIEHKYNAFDAGRYNKALIAKEAIKKITHIRNEARIYHYSRSLPWNDNGERILPSDMFFDYTQKIRELKEKFYEAVEEFLENYDVLKSEAQQRLNGLYNESDYPPNAVLKSKFGFDVSFNPIPDSRDFRISLEKHELEEISKDVEDRVKSAEVNAMKDIWNRLYDAISHMIAKLSERKKKNGGFRDSLVGNIAELVQILPKLNISDDPNLTTKLKEIEDKLLVNPETLRNDNKVKAQTCKDAKVILDSMAGYCG
jgi:hypothetical protein